MDQAERLQLAMFWLTNRAYMSSHVEDVLVRDNFPKPPDQRYAKRPPALKPKNGKQRPDEVTLSLPKDELDTLA